MQHNTIIYPVPNLQNNKYLYRGYNPNQNLNANISPNASYDQQQQMQNQQQFYNQQMQQNNLSKSLVLNGNKIMQ